MPVQLVEVDANKLGNQPVWWTDLQKIYSEAEPLRRTLFDQELDAQGFIDQALQADNNCFAAALFNDHLIGAVLLSRLPDEWQLRHLCVRSVTRRRGVGSQLMALVAAQAQQKAVRLCVPNENLTHADQVLVRRLGYFLDEKQNCYFLNI